MDTDKYHVLGIIMHKFHRVTSTRNNVEHIYNVFAESALLTPTCEKWFPKFRSIKIFWKKCKYFLE